MTDTISTPPPTLPPEVCTRPPPPMRPGKAGGKRDLNRRRRLAQIQEAGLSLMLEVGIEAVTIDEICTRAGIAKGSYYRYFSGKPALVEALMSTIEVPVHAALQGCQARLEVAQSDAELMAAFQIMALALAMVFSEAPDVLRLYLQEGRGPRVGARAPVRAVADRFAKDAIEVTRAAHSHGLLRDLPPAITTLAVLGAVERLAFERLWGEVEEDPMVIADALVTMVLQGVGVAAE